MLQSFVITLREGLESVSDRRHQPRLPAEDRAAGARPVHWGILASILLSIGAGVLLSRAANQALWEGVLALVAAVLVASLTVHMWRAGRRHRKRD